MSGRVLRLAVVTAIAVCSALVGLTVTALRSGGNDCAVAAPRPSLPDRLRTLGDFDQPYDTVDPRVVEDAAVRAAGALNPDLTGTAPGAPVAMVAVAPAQHDALVVPLSTRPQGGVPARVSGLVAFLRDCTGRAYYSDLRDLRLRSTGLSGSFPAVDRAAAAQLLGGAADAVLVYSKTPFEPSWRDRGSGRTVSAG